jgi:hypothetical protein
MVVKRKKRKKEKKAKKQIDVNHTQEGIGHCHEPARQLIDSRLGLMWRSCAASELLTPCH